MKKKSIQNHTKEQTSKSYIHWQTPLTKKKKKKKKVLVKSVYVSVKNTLVKQSELNIDS